MSFVIFIAFIVVVVVMQTAFAITNPFAYVRSSASVQEQANADVLEALQFHQESILAQVPKTKFATAEHNLGMTSDYIVTGYAYNITRVGSGCSSKNDPKTIQYINAMPLGCLGQIPGSNSTNSSYAYACQVSKKHIEYTYGYWFTSPTCANLESSPDYMVTNGKGNNCNVNKQKAGVSSGCGKNKYLEPATSDKYSSVVSLYFNSKDTCKEDNHMVFANVIPLNGCMVAYNKKGKPSGSISVVNCHNDMTVKIRQYKTNNCKKSYQEVTTTMGSTNCTKNGDDNFVRYVCNKPPKN